MKKYTKRPPEKRPIDDLFARKLGNASLPPNPDGFARLQARLGQREPEARLVFWRNPAVYGYAAAAACLLLVFWLGISYWSTSEKSPVGNSVAVNQATRPSIQKPTPTTNSATGTNGNVNTPTPDSNGPNPEQLAASDKTEKKPESKRNGSVNAAARMNRPAVKAFPAPADEPVLARVKSETKPDDTMPVATSAVDKLAQNAPKPTPTERVLIVTIAEPAALVAARQAAARAEPEPIMARADPADKANPPTNLAKLWRQVKRVKQGEVFARQDSNDEHGLLNRAYSGLKQSFEKDKPAKQ